MIATVSKGFDGSGASIAFLIVGVISLLVGFALMYLSYYYSKNKFDPNVAMQKNWFMRWIYKNRLLVTMMWMVIFVVLGVMLILASCGIVFPTDSIDT